MRPREFVEMMKGERAAVKKKRRIRRVMFRIV